MHLPKKASVAFATAITTGAMFLLSAGTAFAGTGLGVQPDFPANISVGNTNVAATLTITNNSSADVGSITLDSIDLTPQCGDGSTLCSTNKDPGVFSVNAAATGSGACAANTFTVAQTDATNGKVHFTPDSTISLALGAVCTINFTINALKVPTIDSTAGPGIQTSQSAQVTGHDTATTFLPATGSGSDIATVAKASPSIATVPSAGGAIGTTLNDTATLSGGATPTGTVTFKLFPPSDASCSGAASYTDADPTSPYATSPGFASNAAGVWHWTADYAGDANNNATSSPCTAETATITKLDSQTATNIHDGAHNVVTSMPIGSGVHDNAHVTGTGPTPTGTVDFTIYGSKSCDTTAVGTDTGHTLVNGFAESATTTVPNTGMAFRAHYNGDANYNGSTGPCEPLEATKLTPLPLTTIHDASHTAVTSVIAGTTVHDSDMVAAAVNGPIPTGTVDFTWYTNGTCANTGTAAGHITLDGTGVAHPSSDETPVAPGSYSFLAHYNGDANYAAADALCEPLTVTKNSPTISTVLSASSVNVGASVHDTATLSGATASAGGSVTYTVFTNNSCTAGAVDAGTKTVTNHLVPNSNDVPFNSAGTFYWQAVYSGDTANNAATSTCTEEVLTVNKLTPSVHTDIHDVTHTIVTSVAASTTVHDSATVSGSGGTPTGTVDFTWYTNGTCTPAGIASGTGVSLVAGLADPSTSQTPMTPGSYSFKAHYNGDATYAAADGDCEPLTVTQPAGQYCSPGYWKQTQHFDSWVGFLPTDKFSAVFSINPAITISWSDKGKPAPLTDPTLLQALQANGGGINLIAREAVDALLNSTSLSFGFTTIEVKSAVQQAIAHNDPTYLNKFNLAENCPLN